MEFIILNNSFFIISWPEFEKFSIIMFLLPKLFLYLLISDDVNNVSSSVPFNIRVGHFTEFRSFEKSLYIESISIYFNTSYVIDTDKL